MFGLKTPWSKWDTPPKAVENDQVKILWGFLIQTDEEVATSGRRNTRTYSNPKEALGGKDSTGPCCHVGVWGSDAQARGVAPADSRNTSRFQEHHLRFWSKRLCRTLRLPGVWYRSPA